MFITKTALPSYPIEVGHPDISHLKNGNTGVDYVHRLTSGAPGPVILLNALMHGNEYSGAVVLSNLLKKGLKPTCGTWILSFSNVAAFQTFDPKDPDKSRFLDMDMNRVWTEEKLSAKSDIREVKRARNLIPFIKEADFFLDLHSMHEACEPMMVTGTTQRAYEFAKRMGYPRVLMRDEGHADGKRLIDYGDFVNPEKAAIGLLIEAGHHWSVKSVENSEHTLYRFLATTGTLSNHSIPPQYQEKVSQVEVIVSNRCVAQTQDVQFAQNWLGMEVIKEKETIIASDSGEPVKTPFSNCVLVMPSLRHVMPGVTFVRLGTLKEI